MQGIAKVALFSPFSVFINNFDIINVISNIMYNDWLSIEEFVNSLM